MNSTTHADIRDRLPDFYISATALPPRKRPPNLLAESRAICELSKSLAIDPGAAMRHLLDIARHLCGAGTAGLSLLRQDPAGDTFIHWELVSGVLAGREGTDTPRARSPCGLCLDTGISIVISRPEREFHRLADTPPPMVEDLIVPLYDYVGEPLGTLWAAHHDGKHRFHSDDVRILEQLAAQVVLALQLQQQASERRRALAVLESHQLVQRNLLAYDLYQERSLREQAESESHQALLLKDAMIQEVNHRTKNTLQVASSLLTVHAQATASPQVREALLDSAARLNLLAKVHELLYTSPDSTQSVLMPQLLQVLGNALQQSFGRACSHVGLDITSDPMTLPARDAMAIALLANEAITNAYKHAFPNYSKGMITVSLRRTPESTTILKITDTGIGLVAASRGENMGLRLIRALAAQLRGVLEVAGTAGAPGTQVTLTIKGSSANDASRRSVDSGQARAT